MNRDLLTEKVIGCAIEVHRALGPGLLESSYQQCLSHELELNGIKHSTEHAIPFRYKDILVECGYRIDFLIENKLIVELKAVSEVKEIHKAQVLTYMKIAGISTGLLVNFNSKRLVDGIQRFKI